MKHSAYKRIKGRVLATAGLAFAVTCFGCDLLPVAFKGVVVDTGQDLFYGDAGEIAEPVSGERFYGQDSNYEGASFAYKDNGDGTVTDENTRLKWQQTPPEEHLTWSEAAEYAEELELAGYSDWRVPTIKELYSLAAFYGDIKTLTPYIDTDHFDFYYPDTTEGHRIIDAQYWSSNEYVGTTMFGDSSAFGFNFADGRIKAYPTGENGGPSKGNYIRCVRGPRDYAENIFTDLDDGTIMDVGTGLMWMKTDSGATMNWEEALEYAENLVYAGHDDWRLPNAKELQSIVDYNRAPDAADPEFQTAAIDPIFELTDIESWFWTSTTHLENGFGIYVCFGRALAYDSSTGEFTVNAHGAGAQRSDPKSGDPADYPEGLGPQKDQIRIYNYVRCVRGDSQMPWFMGNGGNGDRPRPGNDGERPPRPDGEGGPPRFEDLDVDGDGLLSREE
ncbi:DUF1566 domain-containing protein, partial [Candidatus Hydrogenedentota bacterium]